MYNISNISLFTLAFILFKTPMLLLTIIVEFSHNCDCFRSLTNLMNFPGIMPCQKSVLITYFAVMYFVFSKLGGNGSKKTSDCIKTIVELATWTNVLSKLDFTKGHTLHKPNYVQTGLLNPDTSYTTVIGYLENRKQYVAIGNCQSDTRVNKWCPSSLHSRFFAMNFIY